MPLKLNVPDSSNATSTVSLGGINYFLDFQYNSRDRRYRINIRLGDTPVLTGLKVVDGAQLTTKYDVPDFNHGNLYVIRLKDTVEPVGRNNFGIGKPYELIYYTNQELATLGIT